MQRRSADRLTALKALERFLGRQLAAPTNEPPANALNQVSARP
jgi:hypothetical protein